MHCFFENDLFLYINWSMDCMTLIFFWTILSWGSLRFSKLALMYLNSSVRVYTVNCDQLLLLDQYILVYGIACRLRMCWVESTTRISFNICWGSSMHTTYNKYIKWKWSNIFLCNLLNHDNALFVWQMSNYSDYTDEGNI